jgi:CRISPR-associated protein Cmr6
MIPARRADLDRLNLADIPRAANPGLLLSRYLATATGNSEVSQRAREAVFAAAQSSAGRVAIYLAAFARWERDYQGAGRSCKFGDFDTAGRTIIGFGGASPLEAGITLHATYGLPYIPGTALKGLASHYCHRIWGTTDPNYRGQEEGDAPVGDAFRTLFGTQEEGGLVVFHDGWLLPASASGCLREDVLTPHHSDYYMKPDSELKPPSDFDDPNPVTFLSVSGVFRIVISAGHPELPKEWVERAFELLTTALADWGVGGKTSTGYGRLVRKSSSPYPSTTQPPAPATR